MTVAVEFLRRHWRLGVVVACVGIVALLVTLTVDSCRARYVERQNEIAADAGSEAVRYQVSGQVKQKILGPLVIDLVEAERRLEEVKVRMAEVEREHKSIKNADAGLDESLRYLWSDQ